MKQHDRDLPRALVAVHNQAIADLDAALDSLAAIERALRDRGELWDAVEAVIASERSGLISRISAHQVALFELTGSVR